MQAQHDGILLAQHSDVVSVGNMVWLGYQSVEIEQDLVAHFLVNLESIGLESFCGLNPFPSAVG